MGDSKERAERRELMPIYTFKCNTCATTAGFDHELTAAKQGWAFAHLVGGGGVNQHRVYCPKDVPDWLKKGLADGKRKSGNE